MSGDWRGVLSFSERLAATSKIIAAFKAASPECTSVEARNYAKSNEESVRHTALSLAEYNELIEKQVHWLSNLNSSPVPEDHHVDEHVFPNLPTSGAKIGRYVNAEHCNDGIFSEVFRALDPEVTKNGPKMVALKVTTPDMMIQPHDPRREARILSAAKHEQVIPLLETFQQPGGHFVLAFPYMPCDLSQILRRGPLAATNQQRILRDMFTGLAHIHSLGIIHRDIKPSNVILASPTGPAHIIDFGIAWSPTDPASEPTDSKITDVGTTCFRPPEILFGNTRYGTKLDLWAAGCVTAQVVCLGSSTLFDAGDLGSELALIKSMFQTLGTPDLDVWPEAAQMPDWNKMSFTKYPAKRWEEILPSCASEPLDLVKNMVMFESGRRLSAPEVLAHPFLK